MFLPTTEREMRALGWDAPDVILVSGDTYTDNSYNGTALIGHWLMDHGIRAAVIAQPSMEGPEDIARLGQPKLFWSVSAGCVDSMVANYTPARKFRKEDDFTPGGLNNRRPDRACIAYTNLIKKHIKGRPIFLAGIEASLRRTAHYDFWSDSVRRSILLDSKADGIIYGMAELATLEVARCVRDGEDWRGTRGVCYMSSEKPDGCVEFPSYEDCASDRRAMVRLFNMFRDSCDPVTGRDAVQLHGNRYLVQRRPQRPLRTEELDSLYGSDFENAVHPYYAAQGQVRCMDTVRNSVTTHRGCYGECAFCAIAAHQGRTVVSRSEDSIVAEVERMASRKGFNGIVQDVGGPTANMYGIDCDVKASKGACRDRRCLGDRPCPKLMIDHTRQIRLLDRISGVEGVRRVFVNSGIRYDMILADRKHGEEYLRCIVEDHVSGQLKVAPEHTSDRVLGYMGKPGSRELKDFKRMFDRLSAECGKDQYLTYYFMAAHPGCTDDDMRQLSDFCRRELKMRPEQVQVFTPTPSTESTMMYCTGLDRGGGKVFVEKSLQGRQRQKGMVTGDAQGHKRHSGRRMRPVLPVRERLHGLQEGVLLLLEGPGGQHHDHPVGLPGRRPGRGAVRRRGHGLPQVQETPVGGAGVVPGIRLRPGFHRRVPPHLHQEVQEPDQVRHGRSLLPHGFGPEAAGLRAATPG